MSTGLDDAARAAVTPRAVTAGGPVSSPLCVMRTKEDDMKVFVAGASGALGKRLVPILRASGHDGVAMTRSPGKAEQLRALGAEPVVADGLDRAAVTEAVVRAEPEVVVHQMTALGGMKNIKHFDDEFAVTNRLRTTGTDYL